MARRGVAELRVDLFDGDDIVAVLPLFVTIVGLATVGVAVVRWC